MESNLNFFQTKQGVKGKKYTQNCNLIAIIMEYLDEDSLINFKYVNWNICKIFYTNFNIINSLLIFVHNEYIKNNKDKNFKKLSDVIYFFNLLDAKRELFKFKDKNYINQNEKVILNYIKNYIKNNKIIIDLSEKIIIEDKFSKNYILKIIIKYFKDFIRTFIIEDQKPAIEPYSDFIKYWNNLNEKEDLFEILFNFPVFIWAFKNNDENLEISQDPVVLFNIKKIKIPKKNLLIDSKSEYILFILENDNVSNFDLINEVNYPSDLITTLNVETDIRASILFDMMLFFRNLKQANIKNSCFKCYCLPDVSYFSCRLTNKELEIFKVENCVLFYGDFLWFVQKIQNLKTLSIINCKFNPTSSCYVNAGYDHEEILFNKIKNLTYEGNNIDFKYLKQIYEGRY